MLTDLLDKIKTWVKENQRDLFLGALVFLVSAASFGLGRLSAIWPAEELISIEDAGSSIQNSGGIGVVQPSQMPNAKFQIPDFAQGNFVASSKGSAYHLPNCPGAKHIREENRLWFETAEDARAAGYRPAGNCPGL